MLSPNGNPQARNLEIIGCLQEREGVHLKPSGPVTGNVA